MSNISEMSRIHASQLELVRRSKPAHYRSSGVCGSSLSSMPRCVTTSDAPFAKQPPGLQQQAQQQSTEPMIHVVLSSAGTKAWHRSRSRCTLYQRRTQADRVDQSNRQTDRTSHNLQSCCEEWAQRVMDLVHEHAKSASCSHRQVRWSNLPCVAAVSNGTKRQRQALQISGVTRTNFIGCGWRAC